MKASKHKLDQSIFVIISFKHHLELPTITALRQLITILLVIPSLHEGSSNQHGLSPN